MTEAVGDQGWVPVTAQQRLAVEVASTQQTTCDSRRIDGVDLPHESSLGDVIHRIGSFGSVSSVQWQSLGDYRFGWSPRRGDRANRRSEGILFAPVRGRCRPGACQCEVVGAAPSGMGVETVGL